jgi:multidrug efflux pump
MKKPGQDSGFETRSGGPEANPQSFASLSEPFIFRPVGTALLTLALALAGMLAYTLLPVSALPQVDFPTISVSAGLPGASPETMASSVATPLERQFGRIAGVTEMTSTSYLGSTSITLQFDLNRNIDAAARDVQAAINAAAGQLPANLPMKPTYRKVNPADAPIMIMSVTSDIYDKARMYDAASSILSQKIAQAQGVGQVIVGGGALPAVRVDLNPTALSSMGIGLEDIRATLSAANANKPKGQLADDRRTWSISSTDQLFKAKEYQPLIVAFRNGLPVHLSDIATVSDSVENTQTTGLANGKPAVAIIVFRQPGANIVATVDGLRALLPQLQATIPAAMQLSILLDRTTTIRASVRDTEYTLMISVCLVIAVVFLFLRDVRSTLIPGVAVPVSLIGTFGVMYLAGYSIDNLSLMALTIATGFVVDDAIVVVENITRYREQGATPLQAALRGAKEIGFTVLSISISLVAVFIPILLMGGIVGRLFREFAVVLSVAIGMSLVVSLTTTPMMAATILLPANKQRHGRFYRASERVFDFILGVYEGILRWVLGHQVTMLLITLATVGLTIYLYVIVPKGFFPQQDTGRLSGQLIADQSISSGAMRQLLTQFASGVSKDPAVENVVAFAGTNNTLNTGSMFVTLKPLEERKISADEVNARLRKALSKIPGGSLYFQSVQDVRTGGRAGAAQYQYTLQGETLDELARWAPQVLAKLRTLPGLVDVVSDQLSHGLQAQMTYDRPTAQRLGLTALNIDNTLYDAFGQRQISTMYTQLNQYHVVMEVDPKFSQDPSAHRLLYVNAAGQSVSPLVSFTSYQPSATLLAANHHGQFPAVTISFNLKPGMSLGQAVTEIQKAQTQIGLPATIHGSFAGTAQAFQDALANQPLLILAALMTVYIVLGILYESYVHPITIILTIPPAGVGALLALMLCHIDFSIISLIGIILLIGIVKKNAILMIDFALQAERNEGKSPKEAIFQACLLRFRPITMTTMTALLGALPLALGTGIGSELRRPLGVAIVGGLIFSQALTLFTTPVVYLFLDRFRLWCRNLLHVSRRQFSVDAAKL